MAPDQKPSASSNKAANIFFNESIKSNLQGLLPRNSPDTVLRYSCYPRAENHLVPAKLNNLHLSSQQRGFVTYQALGFLWVREIFACAGKLNISGFTIDWMHAYSTA